MNTSRKNNRQQRRQWIRRGHRWLGVAVVAFVILLSITGMALNHVSGLGLDRHYVDWDWLLNAYGIEVPMPTASYEHGGHRATLLGGHLYVDGMEIDQDLTGLVGLVAIDSTLLVAGERAVLLLTDSVEVVESIDLGADLSGPIESMGIVNGVPIVRDKDRVFVGNADITRFLPASGHNLNEVQWSIASEPNAAELAELATVYRGRGLTLERVVLDLHSGRIFPLLGTFLLDLVAVLLTVLSLTGLFLSFARNRRQPANRSESLRR